MCCSDKLKLPLGGSKQLSIRLNCYTHSFLIILTGECGLLGWLKLMVKLSLNIYYDISQLEMETYPKIQLNQNMCINYTPLNY